MKACSSRLLYLHSAPRPRTKRKAHRPFWLNALPSSRADKAWRMLPRAGVALGRMLKLHPGDTMTTENIFTGLKVVDFASFIAGPGAATVLSDFGAEVIKVEPPGTSDPHRITYKIPPQPRSDVNYFWHLDNRNKRGIAVHLKLPQSREIL